MPAISEQESPIHLSLAVGRKYPVHLTLGELGSMSSHRAPRSPWAQVSGSSGDRLGLAVFGLDRRGLAVNSIANFAERRVNIEATMMTSLMDVHTAYYVLRVEPGDRGAAEAAFHEASERLVSDELTIEPIGDEPSLRYELLADTDNTPGVLAHLAGLTAKNRINIAAWVGGSALGRRPNKAENTGEAGRFGVHMKLDVPKYHAIPRLARVKSELVRLKRDRGWDYVLAEGSLSPEPFFRRAADLESQ